MQRTGLGAAGSNGAAGRDLTPGPSPRERGATAGLHRWIGWKGVDDKAPTLDGVGAFSLSLVLTKTSTEGASANSQTAGICELLSRGLEKPTRSWHKQKGLFLSPTCWTYCPLLRGLFPQKPCLVSMRHLQKRIRIVIQVHFHSLHQEYLKAPAESQSLQSRLQSLLLFDLEGVERTYRPSTPTLLAAHPLDWVYRRLPLWPPLPPL